MLVFGFIALCTIPYSHQITIDNPACLTPVKGYLFELCGELHFNVDGKKYSVPKGFITDLASVPRPLWSIYAPHRVESISGAIIHDYFYRCHKSITRRQADDIFYDVLVSQGFPTARSILFWVMVRLFGGHYFADGGACNYGKPRTKDAVSNMRVAYGSESYGI